LTSNFFKNSKYFKTKFLGSLPPKATNKSKLLLFLFALVTITTQAQSPGDIAQSYGAIPAGFNNLVNTIFVQSDGKILVGGGFTTYNGVTENNIIRLNSDGTKDTSYNIGTGLDISSSSASGGYGTIVNNVNDIFAFGNFDDYNGNSVVNFVKMDSVGLIYPCT
jgi:hypothetical protein